MTDEERAKVLSDLFGKYCSMHQSKRARDLDADSIAFLVKQMRVEIERVPDNKKQALVEAQRVCGAEEFSDARLERFLRCVDMDVQVRAGVITGHLDGMTFDSLTIHAILVHLAGNTALCKLLEVSTGSVRVR